MRGRLKSCSRARRPVLVQGGRPCAGMCNCNASGGMARILGLGHGGAAGRGPRCSVWGDPRRGGGSMSCQPHCGLRIRTLVFLSLE
jgi:hypothetical protein